MSAIFCEFKNKYEKMAVPVKAAFWFMVCNFVQRGISVITTPIFTRLFSTEEYGLYSTYISWESVFLLIVTLTLNKAMLNLYVKYDNKEQVLSAVCGLELTLSLIWFVIGISFRKKLAILLGITPVLVCCLFCYCISQSVFQCWSLYKRYIYDYQKIIIVTLLSVGCSSILSVVFVCAVSPSADIRAIATTIVSMTIGIALNISIFCKARVYFDKKIWLFSLRFCIPLLPHYLSEFVLQSSDKIMINYFCGSSDVALYSVAYSAGSLINLVTSAVNSTFAPYQYQKIKAREYKTLARRTDQVLLFISIMLAGIMLFSREIVLIFGGRKYLGSVNVIIPICIGVFFNYVFQLFARVQEYYERKITVVIPSILCALLNIILNVIFIKMYGFQAAAYTTFFCYAFFCLLHYFFYKRVCRVVLDGQKLYHTDRIFLISVGITVAGMGIMFMNSVLWLKYIMICTIGIYLIIFRKRLIDCINRCL